MISMSVFQQVITIIMVVIGTMTTRFIAFIVFPPERETPEYIKYLGNVLPPAALGMLVIYCLKNVSIFSNNHAIPEAASLIVLFILHYFKRNMLLSIAVSTFVYMFIVQVIF